MSDPNAGVVLALDTETGGLSAKANPLLSIAVVAADINLQELAHFSVKFHPPAGTVIELPIPEHRTPTIRGKKIMGYLDVFTGQPVEDVQTRPIITAVAAEINGYMPIKDGTWDMQFPPEWHREAISYDEGVRKLFDFVQQWFKDRPSVVAHNAKFDNAYTETYLPKFYAVLGQWFCTCDTFRAYNTRTKNGLKASLDSLCKTAGYTQLEIDRAQTHGALPDARGCLAGLRWLRQNAA